MRPCQKQMSAFDKQEGGNHYKMLPIQPTEYILANNLGWCESNVIKYISRWQFKNGLEDLKKARHYLDILIERQTPDEEPTNLLQQGSKP